MINQTNLKKNIYKYRYETKRSKKKKKRKKNYIFNVSYLENFKHI